MAIQSNIVKYETKQGEIELSSDLVKKYLVNGNGAVTDQEVLMFLSLCKYRRLNPFLREAYLIKYGNSPAQIIVGKDALINRANEHPGFKGFQAGIIIQDKSGGLQDRPGAALFPGEMLMGGWAKVYREGFANPIEIMVSLAEYERRKENGEAMANWKTMPATMIRKVALTQALREAFPDTLSGMYAAEEMPVDMSKLDDAQVTINVTSSAKEELASSEQKARIKAEFQRVGIIEKDAQEAMVNDYKNGSRVMTWTQAGTLIDNLAAMPSAQPVTPF